MRRSYRNPRMGKRKRQARRASTRSLVSPKIRGQACGPSSNDEKKETRMKEEKELVVYHAECPDGFAAALAARMARRDAVELAPYGYGTTPTPDFKGRDVLMIDCCLKREDLLKAKAEAKSFRVLDHHKSAMKECGDLEFCDFDMKRSGAGLAWDHFFPGQPRLWLFDHVQDRDLWKFRLKDTKAFCHALDALPLDLDAWEKVARMEGEEKEAFLTKGRAMLEKFEAQCRDIVRDAVKATFMGHRVWALNATRAFADRCGEMLCERGDADFALIWNSKDLKTARLSMRSESEFDVSEIAVSFGGGGHAQAAGARIPLARLMEELKLEEQASPRATAKSKAGG